MILDGEIKDAKMASFSSDFQTLIIHKILLYFLYELLMSLRSTVELLFADTPAVNRTLLSMAPLWQCP